MTPINLTAALDWRKASYSSGTGSCVEVGQTPVGNVAVRDTTDRSGPALGFCQGAWCVFVAGVRAGRIAAAF
jgi:hypothetical protein